MNGMAEEEEEVNRLMKCESGCQNMKGMESTDKQV
jgi:hypothetical protein